MVQKQPPLLYCSDFCISAHGREISFLFLADRLA
jgi:hypothetical protein